MFERGLSIDQVAWYLLMETKIPNWKQAKQIASEMRNDYENTRKEIEDAKQTDETTERIEEDS